MFPARCRETVFSFCLAALCLAVSEGVQADELHSDPATRKMACGDCHESPHRPGWPSRCANCHGEGGGDWKTAADGFSARLHKKWTGFAVTPVHVSLGCAACHDPAVPFAEAHGRGVLSACGGCHDHPHGKQFQGRYSHCQTCHSRNFSPGPLSAKDHQFYPLTGAHRAVSCSVCHEVNKKTGVRRFAGTPRECDACHRDPHRSQLAVKGRTDCSRCHSPDRLRGDVRFDHDTTGFPLGRGHRKLSCRRCHPFVPQKDGAMVIQFKPISRLCEDCHTP